MRPTVAWPFDAVLMGVQMPELDGYAAARALCEVFPNGQYLPLIGLTASVLPEDRGLAAGMNDILAKPFGPALLHARLSYFTGRRTRLVADVPPPVLTPTFEPSITSAVTLRPGWQLLEELAGSNDAFIQQIVKTFLNEASFLEELLGATLPADAYKAAQVAHKLKGQVAYFGVPVLHTQLDEPEHSAHRHDCTHCTLLLLAIRQQRQL